MALLWKTDGGYSNLPTGTTFTSLSQFTWLDKNNSFGFAQGKLQYSSVNTGVDNWLKSLISMIGDDVYRLYGIVKENSALKYPAIRDIFPSMYLQFNNMRRYWADNTPTYVAYHIKSLNRVVVRGDSKTSVYKVNGDSLELLIDSLNADINFYEGQNPSYPHGSSLYFNYLYAYNGSVNSTDILNRDNWTASYTYVAYADNSSGGVINSPLKPRAEDLVALFSDYSDPDYDAIVDPYEPVDPSGPSDGQGSFDDSSDTISDSSIPTLSSANTGFTRIYNPTLAQVQSLANYLWTDTTVIDTIWNHIKQYFEDPMQAIIGFNLVPVTVPDGGQEEFKLMFIGTGVQMTVAASQFVDVDCGTLSVPEYYGSALDYTPYTKISAFLPFIGNVDLNPDEIMGRTLQVKYRVDICSGSCVAKILVDGNVLYQYSGHCAIPIPLSSADFSSYVSAAVSVAKLAIGAAVGGAMGAAAVGGTEALQATGNMQQTRIINTERNPVTGRQITSSTQTIISQRPQSTHQTEASFGGITPANITNTVGEIMGSKPFFQHSGSFSGNTGYLGVRRPYLIIIRPRLCMPSDYQKMNGYPCMMTLKLGDCSGYTRVQQVQLTGMTATNPEQSEILQLLKMGVII